MKKIIFLLTIILFAISSTAMAQQERSDKKSTKEAEKEAKKAQKEAKRIAEKNPRYRISLCLSDSRGWMSYYF